MLLGALFFGRHPVLTLFFKAISSLSNLPAIDFNTCLSICLVSHVEWEPKGSFFGFLNPPLPPSVKKRETVKASRIGLFLQIGMSSRCADDVEPGETAIYSGVLRPLMKGKSSRGESVWSLG